MKSILIGILAVAILGIGGWQVYDRYLAGPEVPSAVIHAERALATPQLVALASLDVAALARLEQELQGAPSEADADDAEEPDALTDLIGDIGIDPRRDVTWVVGALHALEEGDLGLAFAVFGHFDPAAFEAALREDPGSDVREARVAGQRVLVVDRQDPDDCEESKTWVFHLSPARVLVAVRLVARGVAVVVGVTAVGVAVCVHS